MKPLRAQLALREWRRHMSHPARLTGLAGAAVILTIMGPFGTGEVMRSLPRLVYWVFVVTASYSIGYAANTAVGGHLGRRIAGAGALTALGAVPLVLGLNVLVFGYWPDGRDLPLLVFNICAISVVISAIFQVAYSAPDVGPEPGPEPGPSLAERLPLDKRGQLVSLSVEDHYVRIRTTKGEELVLMRLSDAIREARNTPGLQVHRSHWVALDQVRSATRKGDGALLTLSSGPDIPVSRANVPAIRKAGLLPK